MYNYIALMIPLFLALIWIEWSYSIKKNDGKYQLSNTAINVAVGAIDQLAALAYLYFFYQALVFSQLHFQVFALPKDWRQWALAVLAVDFVSYWYHRFSHRNHVLWAGHVTHHSSTRYNFSNGFRTSPFQGLFRIPFWMLLPLLGFDPLILVVTFKIVGIHDFFVHTPYVGKLGWLEYVFVTPSHHRVHHGKNDIYLDKNYGSMFIFWDKIFGTYQEETVEVLYGVKSDYQDTSPLNAIFYHFRSLGQLMWNAKTWGDRFKLFFMPPDWVPIQSLSMELLTFNKQKLDRMNLRYGLFLMSTGIMGFVYVLFIYKTIHGDVAAYCFAFVVTQIIQAAFVLQDQLYRNFYFLERFRYLFLAVVGFIVLKELIYLKMVCMVLLAIGFILHFELSRLMKTISVN